MVLVHGNGEGVFACLDAGVAAQRDDNWFAFAFVFEVLKDFNGMIYIYIGTLHRLGYRQSGSHI